MPKKSPFVQPTRFAFMRNINLGPGAVHNFRIRQVCDTHQDAEGFRSDIFADFVKQQIADPKSVWIHGGDLTDSERPTTRHMKKIMYADRHEAWTMEDKRTFDFLDRHIIPQYAKIADSCLGMVSGDHGHVFANGMDSTEYICKKLRIPYLGERSAWCVVRFIPGPTFVKSAYNNSGILRYVVHIRHGKGAAPTNGGDMNALINQETEHQADLHIGAHSHKQNCCTRRVEHLSFHNAIRSKIITYVRGGSFLDGFPPNGAKTYAYRKEYKPLPCGWGEVELTIGRQYHGIGRCRQPEIRLVKASIISAA